MIRQGIDNLNNFYTSIKVKIGALQRCLLILSGLMLVILIVSETFYKYKKTYFN
jgi:hypothetical protein